MADQQITPEQAKSLMSVLAAYRDTSLFDKLNQEINGMKTLLSQNKDS